MKKLKYILSGLFLSFFVFNSVFADDTTDSLTWVSAWTTSSGNISEERMKKIKENMEKKKLELRSFSGGSFSWATFFSGALLKKQELEKLREEKKEEIEQNKEKMKENRQEFRADVKELKSTSWALLTSEQKEKIKALNDAMKVELAPLIEKLRQEKNIDARKILIDQINEIHKKYVEKVKEIVGENANLLGLVDKRIEVLDENKLLRQENLDTRKEWREAKAELIEKYKTAFMNKLKSKLDTISAEKLEKVLTKVNAMIEKTLNNNKLSQTSKEKIIAQLEALKEILENKIDETTIINDEIDLGTLFE